MSINDFIASLKNDTRFRPLIVNILCMAHAEPHYNELVLFRVLKQQGQNSSALIWEKRSIRQGAQAVLITWFL